MQNHYEKQNKKNKKERKRKFTLICLPIKRPYPFGVCSENKGCCVSTKNTVLFPICRIGPRSPLKIASLWGSILKGKQINFSKVYILHNTSCIYVKFPSICYYFSLALPLLCSRGGATSILHLSSTKSSSKYFS